MSSRILSAGEKVVVHLVADANVLLAAILGGNAKLVFQSEEISQIFTTETTFAEVEKYALVLARKRHLSPGLQLLALASLPVSIKRRAEYAGSYPKQEGESAR